jgi:hypothetical protein
MSTKYFSNDSEIDAWLRASVAAFDIRDRGVGHDAAEAVADGIIERSHEQQKGATVPWPENSDNPPGQGYRSKKGKRYGTTKTNFRTGQMLSRASVLGTVVITKNTVEIRYGTGKPPTSSVNGYIEERDKQITDVEKAEYADELGRPFFELDETICDHIFDIIGDGLGDHIRSC